MQAPDWQGVTVLTREPMDVKRRAVTDRVIEVMRSRHDRYLRYHYVRILNAQRDALLALDHVPDEEEVRRIVESFDARQERVLATTYRQLFPEAQGLVQPPEKSVTRMQRKAVDDVVSERLEQWIRANLLTHVADIDSTTIRMVLEMLGGSTDMDAYRGLISSVFRNNPNRAYTIARTETTAASNTAMQVAAEEYSFDRPVSKTWETRMTGTVRPTHEQMQGVTIPMDELFRVPKVKGGHDLMMYPGDYSRGASAENIVNCRCWCSYEYDD